MAYSEIKEAITNLNDQLHFSTSGNGPPRPSDAFRFGYVDGWNTELRSLLDLCRIKDN